MTKKFWTTADGRKLKYKELSDDHLKNIIRDGYRNPNILKEAKRRKFDVPKRPIDELTYLDLMRWVESFASCAIEGNEAAEGMMKLWNKDDKTEFMFALNHYMMMTRI